MKMCKNGTVVKSYAGKSVFLTGCTGLIGKVLLEKLLYSCTDIEKIYILIRSKKGLTIEERLRNLLQLPVFTRLKNERPKDLEKIIPVCGDINEHKLGISAEDERILIKEVSFVFHSAANVKFHESLHILLNTNFKGTERVLSLCKRMKKLQVLVHVSTAYSNTHKIFIEEKLYPPPVPVHSVDELIREQPGVDRTKQLLGNKPNAYSFAKSLGEALLSERHGNVPVVIVRPTIVTASLFEPNPGWIDNWNGATGLIAAAGKGICRVIPGKGSNVLDLIPVDYVVNLMIVAATQNMSNEVIIYNIGTSTENPITLKQLVKPLRSEIYKLKFNELPMPSLLCTNSSLILWSASALLQTFPIYVADAVLQLSGKDPKYRKVLSRMEKVRDMLAFYTTNSWKFSTRNSFILAKSLSNADRQTFPFSPSSIDWSSYLKTYLRGIDEFLLKNKRNL